MEDNTPEYWDKEWDKRIIPNGGVIGNNQKVRILIQEIWSRPQLMNAMKLEIGCGPATHARHICKMCHNFGKGYLGIDTSQKAIDEAEGSGLHVMNESIYSFETDLRFDAFFFFDVLEHIKDHESVALKIKELGKKEFSVLINVPLYRSNLEENGGFERGVDIQVINNFFHTTGVKNFNHKIYGIRGYPYMFAEGIKK